MFQFGIIEFWLSSWVCYWGPGYNWTFLTIFDFTIIFHRKTIYLALFGVSISAQPHVWLYIIFFMLTYSNNTMDLKSQNNIKSE